MKADLSLGTLPAQLISRRWRFVSILVLLGMLTLARLGVWQLDRLAQRRATNAALAAQLAATPLAITGEEPEALLLAGHNRPASATGTFDPEAQFVLLAQTAAGQPGVNLVTPLRLAGSERALLVNRGWLPASATTPAHWAPYNRSGSVTVTGYLQVATLPAQLSPDNYDNSQANPMTGWFYLYIDAIQQQFPYPLLPVHLLASDGPANGELRPLEPAIDLSEGPHLGYALQWFLFSAMLGLGYLVYVWRRPSTGS